MPERLGGLCDRQRFTNKWIWDKPLDKLELLSRIRTLEICTCKVECICSIMLFDKNLSASEAYIHHLPEN